MTEDEFGKKCMKHYTYLTNMLLSFAQELPDQSAEDLASDAIYKALKNRDRFREGTNLRAWLATIARNNALTKCERQRLLQKHARHAHSNDSHLLLSEHSLNNRTPAADFELDSMSEGIRRAFEKLNPDFTECIVAFHVEGLGYREISDRLDIPIGTVMSRLFRGRIKIRALLEDEAKEMGVL